MRETPISFPGDEFGDSVIPPEWEDVIAENLLQLERDVQAGKNGAGGNPFTSTDYPESVARTISGMQDCLLQIEEIRLMLQDASRNATDSFLRELQTPVDADGSTVFDPEFVGEAGTKDHSPDLAAGEDSIQLDKFRLIGKLGEGTYGIVYQALDPQLNRMVAVKVPSLNTISRPDLRSRFLREGESAARLTHPNIVTVFEAVAEGPISLIVSEYIPGPNLANWLKEHPGGVPAKQAARLVAGLAEGVAHAHARNVLHRDIKPSNILLAPKQSLDAAWNVPDDLDSFVPKITDFGLAKLLEHQDATLSGVIVGTPAYMPPEQIAGKKGEVGPAADIYSLGMVLYELLSGANPFLRDSLSEVIHEVTHNILPPLPSAPADLATICLKCLRSDPGERYGSALELSEDLNLFLENRPIQARNVTWMEHFAKWCRRNPFLATTVCSAFFVLLSLSVGLSAALGRATEMESIAKANAKEADERAKEAEDQRNELLRRYYTDDMQIAGKAWNDSNDDEALRRLERYLPKPGDKDFRTFPWWLMYRSITESSKTLTRHEGGATAVAVQDSLPVSMAEMYSLAHDSQGNAIIIWSQIGLDDDGYGIMGQKIDSSGNPVGFPFSVNTTTRHSQTKPSVAMARDGKFIVVWEDRNEQGAIARLIGQRFDRSGAKLGSEIHIRTIGMETHESPSVAMIDSGATWVAFTATKKGEDYSQIHMQLLNPDGGFIEPEVKVSTDSMGASRFETGAYSEPHVAINHLGESIVAWIDGPAKGEKAAYKLKAQRFSPEGHAVDENFKVQLHLDGAQQPDVSGNSSGHFVACWCTNGEVCARHFFADGTTSGEEVQCNSFENGTQYNPQVSINSRGESVVVWESDGQDRHEWGVFAQRFDPLGKKVGGEFQVSSEFLGFQSVPDVVVLSDGSFLISWIQGPCDGRPSQLQIRKFSSNGQPLGKEAPIIEKAIASGGKSGEIRLTSAHSGRIIAELKGHTKGPIQTLQFFQQGTRNWLLSAAEDGYARLWDLNTLQEIRSFQHSDWLPVARFIGKNAERIATGGADGIIRIWDPLTGNLEKEIKGHTEDVRALCDLPERDLLFSSSEDDTVRVWNWRTGEPDWRLPEGVLKTAHLSWTSTLDLSPDSRKLIAGYRSGGVCLWNVAEGDDFGTIARTFHVMEGIRRIRWTDDQSFMIGAGKLLREYRLHFQEGQWKLNEGSQNFHGLRTKINDLTWTPESQELISADESGSVSFWPKRTIRGDIEGIEVPTRRVGGAGTFFNGQWMSLNRGEKVFVSPIRPGPCRFELVMQDIDPNGYHCPLPGGKGVMVSDEVKGEYLFSAYVAPSKYCGDPAPPPVWRVPVGNRRPDNGNCSPDGQLVAVCCDMTLHVIDSDSGKRVLEYKHPAAVSDTQFSPDGKTLFSTCADGKLRSWETTDWAILQERQVSSQALTSLSVSLDGKRIAVAGLDKTARVWEDMDLDPVATISLPVSSDRIAILDDGATLGVVLANSRVGFYNIADQREMLAVESHDGWRYDFSPDRSHLIGRDSNFTRSIFLWKGVRDGD